MTRIATSLYFQRMTDEIGRQQTALSRVQNQIGTGKRILRPSDDPAAAARIVDLEQSTASLEQYRASGVYAEQRLSLEESTLGGVSDLVQRVREIAVAASNTATQTPESMTAFRAEVRERFGALVDLANTQGSNGEFIFAGFRSKTVPFARVGSEVNYLGDQGQPNLRLGPSRQIAIADSGDDVFLRVPVGNGDFAVSADGANTGTALISAGSLVGASSFGTEGFEIVFTAANTYDVVNTTTSTTLLAGQSYSSGAGITFNNSVVEISGVPAAGDRFTITPGSSKSIFSTLSDFEAALSLTTATPAQQNAQNQALSGVLANLERALDHILAKRTEIGARQNAVASAEVENEAAMTQLSITKSQLEDLDYAEAIGRMQFQLTTFQAVQATFAQLQGLSLFQQLRL